MIPDEYRPCWEEDTWAGDESDTLELDFTNLWHPSWRTQVSYYCRQWMKWLRKWLNKP